MKFINVLKAYEHLSTGDLISYRKDTKSIFYAIVCNKDITKALTKPSRKHSILPSMKITIASSIGSNSIVVFNSNIHKFEIIQSTN